MTKQIDYLDAAIINELENNARASFADIGKVVGLSGPAVGDRVRRLQDQQVIKAFVNKLNPRTLGYNLEALIRIKPLSGKITKVERMIVEESRFIWCDRVTGDDCYIAKLALVDVAELDDILLPFHEVAQTNTSIVKSSLLDPRLPPLLP